jgi:hypothetical protein
VLDVEVGVLDGDFFVRVGRGPWAACPQLECARMARPAGLAILRLRAAGAQEGVATATGGRAKVWYSQERCAGAGNGERGGRLAVLER